MYFWHIHSAAGLCMQHRHTTIHMLTNTHTEDSHCGKKTVKNTLEHIFTTFIYVHAYVFTINTHHDVKMKTYKWRNINKRSFRPTVTHL